MNKIPTLFLRDFENGHPERLTRIVHPHCLWVVAGEGVATRKYDGTCIRLKVIGDTHYAYARREVKPGATPPPDWEELSTDPDTGKRIGWEEMSYVHPMRRWLRDAMEHRIESEPDHVWASGTYELCGPKINGNPEGYNRHVLIPHAGAGVLDVPRRFDGLQELLDPDGGFPYEGIVWHHPDGRMAKIKRRDFRTVS